MFVNEGIEESDLNTANFDFLISSWYFVEKLYEKYMAAKPI
jgi:hypothetical protein